MPAGDRTDHLSAVGQGYTLNTNLSWLATLVAHRQHVFRRSATRSNGQGQRAAVEVGCIRIAHRGRTGNQYGLVTFSEDRRISTQATNDRRVVDSLDVQGAGNRIAQRTAAGGVVEGHRHYAGRCRALGGGVITLVRISERAKDGLRLTDGRARLE